MDNARTSPPLYCAYLVRLWRETPDATWRASAQSVQNGETVRFGSLRALYAFLDAETSDDHWHTPPAGDDTPTDS